METLIKKAFKEYFNKDVRVLNIPEQDIDMAIYLDNGDMFHRFSNDDLSEFAYDYAITRDGFDNWIHLIAFDIEGIVRNGEVESPPDVEYYESLIGYNTAEEAFEGLLVQIFKDKFNGMLEWWEEHKMDNKKI